MIRVVRFIFVSSFENYAEKYVNLKMETIENRMLDTII